MAKNTLKNVSGKLLSPSEHKALAKLSKVHEPMLKEMEKWKNQREKLEVALADHLDEISKVLQPFYNQSEFQLKKTFATISGKRASAAPNKRAGIKKKSRSIKRKSR